MHGNIFDIQRFCTDDGPGIRTTVFFKGCNLRCAWCHNPESQAPDPEIIFHQTKCVGCGNCKTLCPNHLESCHLCGGCVSGCYYDAREICGKKYTVDLLLEEIKRDELFYQNSGGGVTFSGGECMLQIDFLEAAIKKCKEHQLHTAIDTAGHIPYSSFERILPFTDLFLYDFKCFDPKKHQIYTGVDNRRILDNLKRLLVTGKEIWIRIPVIPTVNDTTEEMEQINRWLTTYGKPKKVELLPYHSMGEHKYSGRQKTPPSFLIPSKEKMKELSQVFDLRF